MAWVEWREKAGGRTPYACWRTLDGRRRNWPCPDRRTADKVCREVERAHAIGEEWDPAAPRGAPTVPEAMKDYLQSLARARSPNTVRGARRTLERFVQWLQPAARHSLNVLSRRTVEDFDAFLVREGLNTRSRLNYIRGVERWWIWCWDDERLGDHTPRPRGRITMPVPTTRTAAAPTWAEMDAAIGAARLDWVRRLLVITRYTGLRRSQAQALRWEDFDLERALLTIRGELGKSTSERAGRIIPISPHLVAELAGWGVREGLVVPKRTVAVTWTQLVKAWEACGVREAVWKGQPGHAMRKGFRTELIAAGGHGEAIEYYCGRATGVRSAYTDPRAHDLVRLVGLIPPPTGVPHIRPMRAKGGG